MRRRGWLLFLGLLLLAACKSAEEGLRQRVEEYWHLRLAGDLVKAYEYEYPTFRKKMGLNAYISSRNNPLARYVEAKILAIKFPEKDVAEVEMEFGIEVKLMGAKKPFTTRFKRTERWVKVDGRWYHVPAE